AGAAAAAAVAAAAVVRRRTARPYGHVVLGADGVQPVPTCRSVLAARSAARFGAGLPIPSRAGRRLDRPRGLLRRRAAADRAGRRRPGYPRRHRHVRVHPHALRPGRAGSRRRRPGRLARPLVTTSRPAMILDLWRNSDQKSKITTTVGCDTPIYMWCAPLSWSLHMVVDVLIRRLSQRR